MNSKVPLSKKNLTNFLFAIVAAVIQALIPGYNPDPLVLTVISGGVGWAAGWVVKEQEKYLKFALTARQRGE